MFHCLPNLIKAVTKGLQIQTIRRTFSSYRTGPGGIGEANQQERVDRNEVVKSQNLETWRVLVSGWRQNEE